MVKDVVEDKKGNDTQFCGTHNKGSPYGTIEQNIEQKKEKIQLWLQEINGIHRYIDGKNNIYCTHDILNNVDTPKIIGKYSVQNDIYSIILE